MLRTFLRLRPAPPPAPPFFPPFCDLNPFTSSSNTMDGGLTFLPHPWVVGVGCESVGISIFVGSTSEGNANTTAVLEIDVDPVVLMADATAAPTGNRGRTGLAFCTALRRTGANAKLADHPEEHKLRGRGRAWMMIV